MGDKIIFFISAYLLFALFLTIYIFTTNILAEGMAGLFGSSLFITAYRSYQDQIKEFVINCRYSIRKLKEHFFSH